MTIRRTLMFTFLLFSVVFAALMTALAYYRSRAALSDEIRLNLETQAQTLMQQVDAMLFERIKDVQGWRRLDLMQEVKVGDVDKRLARFLNDIEVAYAGVYTDIVCVQYGRVVSASDAALIGTPAPQLRDWLEVDMPGGKVRLSRPVAGAAGRTMILRSAIRDAYTGASLAEIRASINWEEIQALLERAANAGRDAVLLDAAGRPLAFSRNLHARIASVPLVFRRLPNDEQPHGVIEIDGAALGLEPLLTGFARTTGYKGLPDLDWTVLVLTPERVAFAAIEHLLWTLVGLLVGIVLIALVLAVRISARTAQPIQKLTRYTRALAQDIDTPVQIIEGGSEIQELSRSFNRMIEELKRSREHLVRVSKLAAAGEMAAKLAHEVRTPLGIIRSSAQLLDRQAEVDEAGHEMLSFMINECDRINQLLTGLLEGARSRAPVLRPNDVREIINQVSELLQSRLGAKGVRLELQCPPQSVTVPCDRDQMVQVLLNLVLNASQAVPRGGRIRITAQRQASGGVAIDVEDDGPGIPAERREEILEPFVSYRAGGIGLGLSIVREIVSMHGGSLTVGESALGGARFAISLEARRDGED